MCAWVLTVDPGAADERLNLVRAWMALVDSTLSRFQPDSELSRLNVRGTLPMPVSPLLWDALSWALVAARDTGGLYSPTVLNALVAAGYDRDFDEIGTNGPGPLSDTWAHPDSSADLWQTIDLNPLHRTVTLLPGVRVDLGGTAKGWAAAHAADMLSTLGPCLVDAGGDLAVRGALPGIGGWPVGVAGPGLEDGAPAVANLLVRDRGVATSGVNYRRWLLDGVAQHHIIDPRIRRPAATDLQTATIVAPDAAQADLHALVVMVLGCDQGLDYLESHSELEGLLTDHAGRLRLTSGMLDYIA